MKIYTELVISMITFAVIHEESFDYSGPVAMCKGGDTEVEETTQEIELSKISTEQWNEYQTRFKPFENKWIKDIHTDASDQAVMAGQVNAGVGAEFDKGTENVAKQSFSAGVDPSSGRFKAATGGLSARRGAATGKAISVAGQAVDDQTYQGLQQAIAMGRGQSATALRDMTSLAYDATGKAIADEQNRQDTNSTWVSSGMSAAGMGLAGWKGSGETKSDWVNPDTGKKW